MTNKILEIDSVSLLVRMAVELQEVGIRIEPNPIFVQEKRVRRVRNPYKITDILEGEFITSRSREILFVLIYTLIECGYLLSSNKLNLVPFWFLFVTIAGNCILTFFSLSCLRDGSQMRKQTFFCVFGIINSIGIVQVIDMFGSRKPWPFTEGWDTSVSNCIWVVCAVVIFFGTAIAEFFGLVGVLLGLRRVGERLALRKEMKQFPPLLE